MNSSWEVKKPVSGLAWTGKLVNLDNSTILLAKLNTDDTKITKHLAQIRMTLCVCVCDIERFNKFYVNKLQESDMCQDITYLHKSKHLLTIYLLVLRY